MFVKISWAWILSSIEDYLLLQGPRSHSDHFNTVNNVNNVWGLRLSWVLRCLGARLQFMWGLSYWQFTLLLGFKMLDVYHEPHFYRLWTVTFPLSTNIVKNVSQFLSCIFWICKFLQAKGYPKCQPSFSRLPSFFRP